MAWAFWLSLLALLLTLPYAALVLYGSRRIDQLERQPAAGPTPRLSVIVPALNEAGTLEPALHSLLATDYPALEVVAVNDRSTDATGAILERLAAQEPRLKVLHVKRLPAGWLGKNHAMHLAAGAASGEYLLFTDADIVFARPALRQALGYAARERLDHLAVLPRVEAAGPLLRMLLVQFMTAFLVRFRPWRVRRDRRLYIGVGAFNLVRREAYERIGGHAALAMAPIDDLMLGKLLKAHGARQDVLFGGAGVRVAWYPSAAAMVRGLTKNSFAGFDFSLAKLGAASLVIALVNLWPLAGLLLGPLGGRAASALALLLNLGMLWDLLRSGGWPRWVLLLAPLATLVSLYMWWRSAVLTLARGGIEWRGTRYPLSELKTLR
jgi:cellulose synthase/poly-beta-1,6-N-acetylglucosamine synthase-like glycosyltransferase